jgi:hypothetical protein
MCRVLRSSADRATIAIGLRASVLRALARGMNRGNRAPRGLSASSTLAVIPSYEVTLSEHPTGPPADSSPWRRTVEASSRPEAVRLAEEVFRSETGREPLHVSVRALT